MSHLKSAVTNRKDSPMQFKNRVDVFKQAQSIHPSLGTVAQSDVVLSPEKITAEVDRCIQQTSAIYDYINLLTSIDSYELPDPKETVQ
jgi:hypothetical protein